MVPVINYFDRFKLFHLHASLIRFHCCCCIDGFSTFSASYSHLCAGSEALRFDHPDQTRDNTTTTLGLANLRLIDERLETAERRRLQGDRTRSHPGQRISISGPGTSVLVPRQREERCRQALSHESRHQVRAQRDAGHSKRLHRRRGVRLHADPHHRPLVTEPQQTLLRSHRFHR